jgi:hypothetical protein
VAVEGEQAWGRTTLHDLPKRKLVLAQWTTAFGAADPPIHAPAAAARAAFFEQILERGPVLGCEWDNGEFHVERPCSGVAGRSALNLNRNAFQPSSAARLLVLVGLASFLPVRLPVKLNMAALRANKTPNLAECRNQSPEPTLTLVECGVLKVKVVAGNSKVVLRRIEDLDG